MQGNIKGNIKQLAYTVNKLLDLYVAIHDDVFKFSIRKLIPLPLIFKKIDYQRNYNVLKILSTELISTLDETKSLQIGLNTSDRAYKFLDSFKQYILALSNTITKLYDICYKMQLKVDGIESYKYHNYDEDVNIYNESVNNYFSYGEKMNVEYNSLMKSL